MYSTLTPLTEQNTDQYNVSVTSGFTEILLSSNFVSYDGSTTDNNDYNETSIIVLLSTTTSSFMSRTNGLNGGRSSELVAGVTVSCITCIIVLLIIVALAVWRYRTIPQQSTLPSVNHLETHKYGAVSTCAVCVLNVFSTFVRQGSTLAIPVTLAIGLAIPVTLAIGFSASTSVQAVICLTLFGLLSLCRSDLSGFLCTHEFFF